MSMKSYRIILFSVLVAVLALAGCGDLPTPPAGQPSSGQIDTARYQALKSQVEDLRRQGRDVSDLDAIVADIEMWIAAGKVAEANLRITDLAGALADLDNRVPPTRRPEAALPPAPAFAPVRGGDVLYAEDFESPGALAAWEEHIFTNVPGTMARWEVRQGALYLNQDAGSPARVGMVDVVGDGWADVVLSVDILPEGNLEVGVVFRYGEGGFYRFRLLNGDYNPVGTRVLERVEGEGVVVLDKQDGPGYQMGQWHNVQVVADGEQLTVYLNGEQVSQALDDQWRDGKVGVYALSDGQVYFDNIRVMAIR